MSEIAYKKKIESLNLKSFTYISKDMDKSKSYGRRYNFVLCKCGQVISTCIAILKKDRGCRKCQYVYRSTIPNPNGNNVLEDRIYATYKRCAEDRNLQFDIDIYTFKILIAGSCYYCGEYRQNIIERSNKKLEYNGIDRLDSSEGYYPLNLVTCCGTCNIMKNKTSFNDFLFKVNKIHKHLNLN